MVTELLTEKAKSKGIIITDHSYDYVLDVATRKYFLKDGRLVQFEGKSELIELGYIPE